MKHRSKILKTIGYLSYALSSALLIASLVLNLIPPSPALAGPPVNLEMQLNLSHILCVNGQVEIHFVLLNVPDGVTPGTLTYSYGTIEPGKNTGNVWHYTDYQPSGSYDVQSASVDVEGQTVSLHNPGDYAGTYNCSEPETVTICYNNVTLTVPVDELDQYPGYSEGACPTPPESDIQLNLSHIVCVDGQVEIHFVLLNVPDGVTPGTLTYSYGTIEPGKNTGNVWHYTDYQPSGSYDVQSASVEVDGQTVTLHNPGDYAGTYNCGDSETVTICYNNVTLTVPVDELDQYPGYSEGACVPQLPQPEATFCYSPVLSEFKVSVVNSGPAGFIGYSTDGGNTIDVLVNPSFSVSKDATSLLLYAKLNEEDAWGDPVNNVTLDKDAVCTEDPLDLAFFCADDSENPNGWRVTNLNDFDIKITWSIENGSSSVGEIEIPAGQTYQFSTPYFSGSMNIYVNGVLQASGTPETCEEETERLELKAVCVDSADFYGWTVTNPNPFSVSFEYTLDGYTIYTGSVNGSQSVDFKTEKSLGKDLTLFASGVLQAKKAAVSDCPVNDPPVDPPTTPPVITTPPTVTTNTTVLIPVTGLDVGASKATSRSLLQFGLGFLGLGLVMHSVSRKHQEDRVNLD